MHLHVTFIILHYIILYPLQLFVGIVGTASDINQPIRKIAAKGIQSHWKLKELNLSHATQQINQCA